MSTPYLSEIKIFSFNFAPINWALCNGQLLMINQNQALFSLLGTNYGGNGSVDFGLPNLQGRTPIHFSGVNNPIGLAGGVASHTLTTAEMPSHTHNVGASTATAGAVEPAGATPAAATRQPYRSGTVTAVSMKPAAVASSGGGQPHNNLQPYLVLNFCIALAGTYPSRN